jgi:hypothetical protein
MADQLFSLTQYHRKITVTEAAAGGAVAAFIRSNNGGKQDE